MAKKVVKKKIETKKRRSPSKKKKTTNNKNSKINLKSILFKLLVLANVLLFLYFGYLYFYNPSDVKKTSIEEKLNRKVQEIVKAVKPERAEKAEKAVKTEKQVKVEPVKKETVAVQPNTIKENITLEANKFLNMEYILGGDPSKGEGVDNSHLMHAIISQSEKNINNGKSNFKYRTMSELIKDSYEISLSQLSNGDLIVLKDGMIGMIIDEENRDGYSVIYVSGKQKKVVKVESSKLGLYWLKSKNKKGYYRLNYLENK